MSGQPVDVRALARQLYADGMRCNCDLDNWEPERSTGHSHVCRIHKAATAQRYDWGQAQHAAFARIGAA